MLIISLVALVLGLLLELFKRSNFGIPLQVIGNIGFVLLFATVEPYVTAAFLAYTIYTLVKALRN